MHSTIHSSIGTHQDLLLPKVRQVKRTPTASEAERSGDNSPPSSALVQAACMTVMSVMMSVMVSVMMSVMMSVMSLSRASWPSAASAVFGCKVVVHNILVHSGAIPCGCPPCRSCLHFRVLPPRDPLVTCPAGWRLCHRDAPQMRGIAGPPARAVALRQLHLQAASQRPALSCGL